MCCVQVLSMSDELRRALYSSGASVDMEFSPPDLIGASEIFTMEHRWVFSTILINGPNTYPNTTTNYNIVYYHSQIKDSFVITLIDFTMCLSKTFLEVGSPELKENMVRKPVNILTTPLRHLHDSDRWLSGDYSLELKT